MRSALVMAVDAAGRTLVGVRRLDLGFLGGYTVFPGGALAPSDAEAEEPLRLTALRELWEETGLLLARDRLIAGPIALRGASLHEAHAALAIPLDPSPLLPVARFVTPSFSSIRFDTQSYLLRVERSDAPRGEPGELEGLEWRAPAELLEEWRMHLRLLAPPTQLALEALVPGAEGLEARFASVHGARAEEVRYFGCAPGILGVPLRTPTLPPAEHTNCYLVGRKRLIAVDPATYDEGERGALIAELERLEARGARLEAVVLTHHHLDHVGSASFLAERRGVPIAAHPITAALVAPRHRVERLLHDGDTIALDDEEGPFPLEVWHTPGHAPGHLVLVDRRPGSRAMIVGDMVASLGTIVIDPPEGDMADYLAQLRRMRARGSSLLFPAHGLPIVDGAGKLDHYVAHREKREALVLAAAEQADTVEGMLPLAYADTPEALWPLAARSCLAHLLKLVRDGRLVRDGERFLRP